MLYNIFFRGDRFFARPTLQNQHPLHVISSTSHTAQWATWYLRYSLRRHAMAAFRNGRTDRIPCRCSRFSCRCSRFSCRCSRFFCRPGVFVPACRCRLRGVPRLGRPPRWKARQTGSNRLRRSPRAVLTPQTASKSIPVSSLQNGVP